MISEVQNFDLLAPSLTVLVALNAQTRPKIKVI
jgi:hypothetical protein